MVQRGAFTWTLHDFTSEECREHVEQWLCRPYVVESTTASDLLVGLDEAMPRGLAYPSYDSLRALAEGSDCWTFLPIGDQASSNVSIMRIWCYVWQFEYAAAVSIPRVLVLPET